MSDGQYTGSLLESTVPLLMADREDVDVHYGLRHRTCIGPAQNMITPRGTFLKEHVPAW